MVIESDYEPVFEIYKTRRKLFRWRLFGVLAALLIVIMFAWGSGAFNTLPADGKDHIARVSIEGTIVNDRQLLKMFEEIGENEQVKAVVLAMSTPGGTVVGGEAIYEAVKKLTEKKPVVTQVGGLAASAGYMIASGSDYIVVRRSSIVGSIGVLFTYVNATGLLENVGLEVKDIKTGLLKAEPTPYSETPSEVEPVMRELLDDSYQWFVDLVAEERNMPRAKVLELADGRVVSGAKAVELKLADAIGGEDEVLAYLTSEKGLDEDLELFTWRLPQQSDSLPFFNALIRSFGATLASTFGFSNSKQSLGPFGVDGLVSIWQASPK